MTVTVEAGSSGIRLDSFIAESVDGLSRSGAQKLIEGGLVRSLGQCVKKNDKTVQGRSYDIDIPEPEPLEVLPQDIPLDIVYEDGDVIVVNKPRGMVVHPAPGHPDSTLVNALLFHCSGTLSGINGKIRPGIVHRIDMDTSGLIIAAKNDFSHRRLAEQLKDHTLSRVYEAVVYGNIRSPGTVDAPIGRHPSDRKRQAVNVKNARSAVTHYEPLTNYSGYCHVRCRLETGRTHQIRVHMAYIGHPIVGDMVYGRKSAHKGIAGQCLHAKSLTFVHPRTGETVTLSCPLPDYFKSVLSKLGPAED